MVLDEYCKGWALRYIREAEAEIEAARTSPNLTPTLIIEAMRKAQAAVYYSLGDPPSVERIVQENLHEEKKIKHPVLRRLVDLEKSIELVSNMPVSSADDALKDAAEIVKVASEMVALLTGENRKSS